MNYLNLNNRMLFIITSNLRTKMRSFRLQFAVNLSRDFLIGAYVVSEVAKNRKMEK